MDALFEDGLEGILVCASDGIDDRDVEDEELELPDFARIASQTGDQVVGVRVFRGERHRHRDVHVVRGGMHRVDFLDVLDVVILFLFERVVPLVLRPVVPIDLIERNQCFQINFNLF